MSESEQNHVNSQVAVSLTKGRTSKASIYGIGAEELRIWLEVQKEKPFRLRQFFEHLYTQRQPFETLSTWPEKLRTNFLKDFAMTLTLEKQQSSRDSTVKWLYKLHDGKFIETVLMTYNDRATICISSQAGCAMGCTFCATGQSGFDRHLNSAEIVEQVARACHYSNNRVSNVVFMGMGEPLANVENVRLACETLANDFGFSARHITVSTVGIVPGMQAMTKWDLPVTLAVSLHAPFDEMRTKLVPINKRYPIAEVLNAAIEVSHTHGRRVSFEYAAIDHSNITSECAHKFGRLLRDFKGAGGAHVNLIPLNQTTNFDGKTPSHKVISRFADIVRSYGPTVTIRRNRGIDIDAACGQLRERVNESN